MNKVNKHPMDGLREIDDKDKEIEQLREALEVAEKALYYCSLSPHEIHPMAQAQFMIANQSLARIQEITKG